MGREFVVDAVAGKERHPAALDVADGDSRRRRAVRRVDGDFDDVVEELVEPGAAEDPDRDGPRQDAAALLVDDDGVVDVDVEELEDDEESPFVSVLVADVFVSAPEDSEDDALTVFEPPEERLSVL